MARTGAERSALGLTKMPLLERDPVAGEPLLGDLVGGRKLVVGDRARRVVWRVREPVPGHTVVEVAEVWAHPDALR
jgi:mRNA interferase RelE/StbE